MKLKTLVAALAVGLGALDECGLFGAAVLGGADRVLLVARAGVRRGVSRGGRIRVDLHFAHRLRGRCLSLRLSLRLAARGHALGSVR